MLYEASLAPLRVLMGILSLSPASSERAWSLRWDLALAIASATSDVREQDTLVRIAVSESSLRSDVAECRTLGDRGKAHGLFQIHPMVPSDKPLACGSPDEQVGVALRYVRRSASACPGNVGADKLAMYVSGTCARGLAKAKHRWAE